MAYINDTAFEVRATNAEFDSLANITGVFSNGTATEICSAGFLCIRGEQLANQGYTGISNANAYTMLAAPATVKANTGVFACNTFGVSEVTDPVTGCVRKIGTNTLGLAAPKDFPCTYTEIDFAANKKIYRFGLGNLSAAIGSNKFFTVANGLLVPAAAAPATNGAVYFELHGVGKFTVGAHAGFDYYDLMARSVTA
ncbi:MAG: hypothetical protein RSA62_07560 [Oscillospiraceae bacterium]